MSVVTATGANVQRESIGSLTLVTLSFSSVVSGDTYVWSSATAPDPVGYWCNGEGTTTGSSVLYTTSTNTFTFYLGATGAVKLYLLLKA